MVVQALVPAAVTIASRFFPSLLGKLVGDRAERIAQVVVNTAAGAAGVAPNASTSEIVEKLAGSPEAQTQLRLSLAQVERETYELEIKELQSARQSQERRGQERGNWMLSGVIIGLIACVLAVATGGVTEPGVLALVTTIAGALLKMLSDAFAFEFGSSRGSKEKDAQIEGFKQALVRVGEERRAAVGDQIVSQQSSLDATKKAFIEGAESQAAITRRATGDAPAPAPQPESRDFVGELEARAAA